MPKSNAKYITDNSVAEDEQSTRAVKFSYPTFSIIRSSESSQCDVYSPSEVPYCQSINGLSVCPALSESVSCYDSRCHDSDQDPQMVIQLSADSYDSGAIVSESLVADVENCSSDGSNVNEESCQEQRIIEEAKLTIASCIATSARLNEYHLTRLLGFGTFGIVVEAQIPGNDQAVAIKIMLKSGIHQNRFCIDPETEETTSIEILLLKHCPPNENIIGFIDSWCEDERIFLVTEIAGHEWELETIDPASGAPTCCTYPWLQTGNKHGQHEILSVPSPFYSYTHRVVIPTSSNDRSSAGLLRLYGGLHPDGCAYRDGNPVVPSQIQKRIFRQLARCLLSLHHSGITHKDIKDENVMVDSQLNVRLIDFGHSAVYKSAATKQYKTFTSYGTPVFSPPEVRSGLSFDGPAGDVYAMGLMMYEHHFGDVPVNFDCAECSYGAECLFEFSPRTGFTDLDAIDLVQWMLQPDPTKRATIEDVISHPYLA
eukprot:Partr_v1_DN26696_c1_g1_i2_m69334 putative serine threonine-protein kinase